MTVSLVLALPVKSLADAKLYFTEYEQPTKLQRVNVDGTMLEDLVSTDGESFIYEVALDPNTNTLYYSDRRYTGTAGIYKISLDDTFPATSTVVVPNIKAMGLALDLTNGHIYFSDSETNYVVYRSDLDGSNLRTVIPDDGYWSPNDLWLDEASGTLYISSVSGAKSGIHKIAISSLPVASTVSLTQVIASNSYWRSIFGHPASGKIYYTDWDDYTVKRANFDGSEIEEVIPDDGFWTPQALFIDYSTDTLYLSSSTGVVTTGKVVLSSLPAINLGTDAITQLMAIETEDIFVYNDNLPPEITSNGGGATAFINVAEESTLVTTITATDPNDHNVSFSISGGADAAKFSIVGATLTFASAPSFEAWADANADNVYVIEVTATDDGSGNFTDTQVISVSVSDVNEFAPSFSSSDSISVAENQTAVLTLSATDPDTSQAVSYSLSGGADQTKFLLSGATLSFVLPQDYEARADADADNVYVVEVTATDNGSPVKATVQTIYVTLTDVSESVVTVIPSGETHAGGLVTITSDLGGINCTFDGSSNSVCTSHEILRSSSFVLTVALPPRTVVSNWEGCDSSTATTCSVLASTKSLTISPVFAFTNVTPVIDQAPTISGTANVGGTLAATTGSWFDADNDSLTYLYQWQSDGSTINGATASSYLLTAAEAHSTIAVAVTAIDGNGGTGTATSADILVANSAPSHSALPTIDGTSTVGGTLNTTEGVWIDVDGDTLTYSYQWYRAPESSGVDGAAIENATSMHYFPTVADAHKYLKVVVTADDGSASNIAISSSLLVSNTPPEFTATASTEAFEGTIYTAIITASDIDGDALIMSAPVLPEWLSFSPVTGLLQGIPEYADAGFHPVTLRVTDSTTAVDNNFSIFVAFKDQDGDTIPDAWEISYGLDPAIDNSRTDTDHDGIVDVYEYQNGTDPNLLDSDGDGLADLVELRNGTDPLVDNSTLVDSDGDGLPDSYEMAMGLDPMVINGPDTDTDGDGFSDYHEYLLGLDPLADDRFDRDRDGDGISDAIEMAIGMDPDLVDNAADFDGDGLTNQEEVAAGTLPTVHNSNLADSDKDGIPDQTEILAGLDPHADNSMTDSDGDGLNDMIEYLNGTLTSANADQLDGDGDALPDDYERANGLDATHSNIVADSDGDGLRDLYEYQFGLDPQVDNRADVDTDGDGISDLVEINLGLDPDDASNAAADPDNDCIATLIEVANGTSPFVNNASYADSDSDGIPDIVELIAGTDPEFHSSATDTDGDGISDLQEYLDGTLLVLNDQIDDDNDGIANYLDNCPLIANADQSNNDGDHLGDACDVCPDDAANDVDSDGVCGDVDNCPSLDNNNQLNKDGDALGDVCDPDDDNDGINDADDEFPLDPKVSGLTLTGTVGNDTLVGSSGSDTIFGDSGDDSLDGGEGADTAIYSGDSQGYLVFVNNEDQYIVNDLNPGDGTEGRDKLDSIESIQFADQTLSINEAITEIEVIDDDEYHWDSQIGLPNGLTISTAEAQLFRTYYGAMMRLPDDSGFAWWLNEIQHGRHTLRTMAAGFIWSEEFHGYVDIPFEIDIPNDVFLIHMYEGVFGREPDQGGYLWWLEELNSNRRTQTDVLVDMTQSNEYVELTKKYVVDYLYYWRSIAVQ